MSQENVEIGQQFVEAVNGDDVEAAVEKCHPGVIFDPLRGATEAAFRGRDGIAASITEFRDGLIWRYKDYGEAGRALQAAGLGD